jgi:hypothetical protein
MQRRYAISVKEGFVIVNSNEQLRSVLEKLAADYGSGFSIQVQVYKEDNKDSFKLMSKEQALKEIVKIVNK